MLVVSSSGRSIDELVHGIYACHFFHDPSSSPVQHVIFVSSFPGSNFPLSLIILNSKKNLSGPGHQNMGRFLHPKQNKTKQGKAQNEEEIKTDSGPDPPPSIYRLATQLGFSLPAARHRPPETPPSRRRCRPALVLHHGEPILTNLHPWGLPMHLFQRRLLTR